MHRPVAHCLVVLCLVADRMNSGIPAFQRHPGVRWPQYYWSPWRPLHGCALEVPTLQQPPRGEPPLASSTVQMWTTSFQRPSPGILFSKTGRPAVRAVTSMCECVRTVNEPTRPTTPYRQMETGRLVCPGVHVGCSHDNLKMCAHSCPTTPNRQMERGRLVCPGVHVGVSRCPFLEATHS